MFIGDRGTGEMAQWLKELTAFADNFGSVPSIHMAVHTIYNSSSRIPDDLFWILWALGTDTHKIKINTIYKKNSLMEYSGNFAVFSQGLNTSEYHCCHYWKTGRRSTICTASTCVCSQLSSVEAPSFLEPQACVL